MAVTLPVSPMHNCSALGGQLEGAAVGGGCRPLWSQGRALAVPSSPLSPAAATVSLSFSSLGTLPSPPSPIPFRRWFEFRRREGRDGGAKDALGGIGGGG
ncbi:hypothetical protein E2562_031554 [Oryza meyeriana var. granulata]|uniref:Uncharacterized protein n=1 Tax=Oryza meyeriana var. granulata TaxID=110450 RepID=A0A6G1CVD6_9ORYZ|nr:hypothetical protein E2562_031554 [Oryza meyeriana var. granulata]